MKSVLISIQPKWCGLIANGKKTVEVRKTKPKLDTPFKVYIYCTKGDKNFFPPIKKPIYRQPNYVDNPMGNGKVIGEFVCDSFYGMCQFGFGIAIYDEQKNIIEPQDFLNWSCLTEQQLIDYIGNNDGYAWHISNLVIYDKPRELYEFKTLCTDFYDGKHCEECDYFIDGRGYEYDESDCGCDGLKSLKRPPQSWCYVDSEVTE